jgi:hypothetical protein
VWPLEDGPVALLLGFKLLWAATGMAVSSALAALYGRLRVMDRGWTASAVTVAVLSAAVGTGWALGLGAATAAATGENLLWTPRSLPFVALNHFFILLAWSGAYLALGHWRRGLKAEALAHEALTQVLHYQIRPHFLFNTLTSIRALIAEDPGRAREAVSRFAEMFRLSFKAVSAARVRAGEEAGAVQVYLGLEKMRFEDRLVFRVRVEPGAEGRLVPPFLLHSLVENAVQHGDESDGALRLNVVVSADAGGVRMEVANTGTLAAAPEPSGNGRGIGLRNLRERLALEYPGAHTFTLEQDGGWVRAVIRLEDRR